MTNPNPLWASKTLSDSLPTVREAGESKEVDFKREFPEQAHRLGKTVASMATSGGGKIYIGVEDDGELYGLNLQDGDARDDVIERSQSIKNSVNPRPEVTIEFAYEKEKTVLVIQVPKQKHPVYYYDGRPYLRDGRSSRIAEPHEVVELVWKHESSEHRKKLEELQFEDFKLLRERNRQRHNL